jgi:hypothetical protein
VYSKDKGGLNGQGNEDVLAARKGERKALGLVFPFSSSRSFCRFIDVDGNEAIVQNFQFPKKICTRAIHRRDGEAPTKRKRAQSEEEN